MPADCRYDVLGFGNSCVDRLMRVPRLPRPGQSVRCAASELQAGGQVATAMVGCARLGLRAGFALRTGPDEFGERQRAALAREGIGLEYARVVPGASSAIAYILVDGDTGERAVIWNTDERLAVAPDEVLPEMIRSARLVYFDGKDEPACMLAARMAREHGIPVASDIDMQRPRTRDLVRYIGHFISNQEFVTDLGGDPDVRRALRNIAALGPGIAIATLGESGAIGFDGEEYVHSPAFPVHAVDTTGAGDAFHAGYIHALLAGRDLRESLRFANATAGLACTVVGAQNGMPRLANVERLLTEHNLHDVGAGTKFDSG